MPRMCKAANQSSRFFAWIGEKERLYKLRSLSVCKRKNARPSECIGQVCTYPGCLDRKTEGLRWPEAWWEEPSSALGRTGHRMDGKKWGPQPPLTFAPVSNQINTSQSHLLCFALVFLWTTPEPFYLGNPLTVYCTNNKSYLIYYWCPCVIMPTSDMISWQRLTSIQQGMLSTQIKETEAGYEVKGKLDILFS